jgi:CubicO group peptidase (beta-lactamase class C family)
MSSADHTIINRQTWTIWRAAAALTAALGLHLSSLAGIAQPLLDLEPELGPIVDATVQEIMDEYSIPGMAVAVVAGGEIAYERGYGIKHRRQGGTVDEHTLFRHGSVGKMLTAAAILRLVDQGLVKLDDPVTEYVPELHFLPGRWTADQIRVRHLIANTAAIPNFRTVFDGSLSEWAGTLTEVPLLAPPGAMWSYSNSNFALADLVVERASGMDVDDYVAAELYQPVGMMDSMRYPEQAVASGNYSYGHADDGQIYAPDDYRDVAGGFTSAHDLALWMQMMLSGGGEVLSADSCEMAQQAQAPRYYYSGHPPSIGGGAYGFGLFIDEYPSATVTWHDGGLPGWVARVAWIRTKSFAVVMLANSWPNAITGLYLANERIFEAVLGVTMPDMSQPTDPESWSQLAGTYAAVFEDGFTFEAVVEPVDNRLLITVPNPQDTTQTLTVPLQNLHDSSFRITLSNGDWWDISFIPVREGSTRQWWIRNQRFVGLKLLETRRPRGMRSSW